MQITCWDAAGISASGLNRPIFLAEYSKSCTGL